MSNYKKSAMYSVPEGFFGQVREKAAHNAAAVRTRRRIIAGALSICIFAAIPAIWYASKPITGPELQQGSGDFIAELSELYDYDVFLQLNFEQDEE